MAVDLGNSKLVAQLTVPRNLNPMGSILLVLRELKKMNELVSLLPPRNFAVFERQFFLEYYTHFTYS